MDLFPVNALTIISLTPIHFNKYTGKILFTPSMYSRSLSKRVIPAIFLIYCFHFLVTLEAGECLFCVQSKLYQISYLQKVCRKRRILSGQAFELTTDFHNEGSERLAVMTGFCVFVSNIKFLKPKKNYFLNRISSIFVVSSFRIYLCLLCLTIFEEIQCLLREECIRQHILVLLFPA